MGLGVEEHIGHLGSLFVIEEITAGLLQQTLDLVIYAGQNGDMLLGGADHAVIEGLGVNDGFHSHPQVSSLIDDHVAVAGAHADSGGAGGIGRLHHAGAAGCYNEIHALHQYIGDLQRGDGDPADDMLRQTRLNGGIPHDLRCGDGAVYRMGVRGEDDGVPGLQRQHDLVDRGGSGVRGGGNGGDHTLGGCDLLYTEGSVLRNDAAGLFIAHVVPDVLRGILILGDLIHNDAVAGLLAGHLGQRNSHLGHSHGCLFADGIHLLLCEVTVRFLRCADQGKGFLQGLNRVDGQWGRHRRSSFFFDHWDDFSSSCSAVPASVIKIK